ncbi:phenylalanine aminomutase (D-beta-phenylalanine forming) [Silvanigrella aquatica]|uniref:Phenylalanine aminomutase (D-beta-phenylalanine forming) n=1 Tax=Silvanigrella aquatica TaxID=1915309 RepID=A0A1L4CXU3_9BACT|nr:phenylalanine aminomutase (D-beta-phenylalanine forming) [Silvanigrella aquatica]APJ02767.1 phenylalanine aminomutase (D-beta-phenylalanine forming) [Silvanigrella aquatica]
MIYEKFYELNGDFVSSEIFNNIINNFDYKIKISDKVKNNIESSRRTLDKFVNENRIIYGVNTSMGGFVNYLVPTEFAEELQNNLIHSVASNVGQYFNEVETRAIMLARIISLSKGASAIKLSNFLTYVEMFNKNIFPCIPEKGSLGASGDLGPLSFIALAGIGKWKVRYRGEIIDAQEALQSADIVPMKLSYKEGLALINGTSAMVGTGLHNWFKASQLLKIYDFVSALSFEGLRTKLKPFDPKVHKRKLHTGQFKNAQNIFRILSTSSLIIDEQSEEKKIQAQCTNNVKCLNHQIEDAYSLRCTPQILGPVIDSMEFIKNTLENELNSSSDNPLILSDENDVFHNGHFHGQYISMVMDYLSINLTTISNLSDRRIDRFMDKNNSNGLPPFLCKENQGLRLGLMGSQFMSTSITAENRSLCVPLSIQTLTSTGDFQDIVSMGLIASRRAREILNNTYYIVGLELICACQAIDIREGQHLISDLSKILYNEVRKTCPFFNNDICITPYIENIISILQNNRFINELNEILINRISN